jgi:hypothetical protein
MGTWANICDDQHADACCKRVCSIYACNRSALLQIILYVGRSLLWAIPWAPQIPAVFSAVFVLYWSVDRFHDGDLLQIFRDYCSRKSIDLDSPNPFLRVVAFIYLLIYLLIIHFVWTIVAIFVFPVVYFSVQILLEVMSVIVQLLWTLAATLSLKETRKVFTQVWNGSARI